MVIQFNLTAHSTYLTVIQQYCIYNVMNTVISFSTHAVKFGNIAYKDPNYQNKILNMSFGLGLDVVPDEGSNI